MVGIPINADDECSYIAIMGPTGSGKTTFVNLASGSNLQVGMSLQACTHDIGMSKPFRHGNHLVRLVDTPGFDDTNRNEADILGTIASYFEVSFAKKKQLAGIIYMHRISDNRVGGISKRNFRTFRKLCGVDSMKNVLIITNMWSKVSLQEGETRERELRQTDILFKPALDNGAKMIRNANTPESARDIISQLISLPPTVLDIQKELCVDKKELFETSAGQELGQQLLEQEKRHAEEVAKIKKEMADALKARDDKWRDELEEERKRNTEGMERIQREMTALRKGFVEERDAMEKRLNEMETIANKPPPKSLTMMSGDELGENKLAVVKKEVGLDLIPSPVSPKGRRMPGDIQNLLEAQTLFELKQDLRSVSPTSFVEDGGYFSAIGKNVDIAITRLRKSLSLF